MKFKYMFTVLAIAISQLSIAQTLNPTIGIGSLPADGDSVCPIQIYIDSSQGFTASGLQQGDTAADFTLYDVNGNLFNLSSELQKGKPILMVAGSYTCPVYRDKLGVLNSIASTYSNDLTAFIVYVVEAHPDVDVSPYSGTVWTVGGNTSVGIVYQQPKTYGERKAVLTAMMGTETINVPVYIDGPCNNWWDYYGPAPNNAYLIHPNGTVAAKHGWFDKAPTYNMVNDIDALLASIITEIDENEKPLVDVTVSPNPAQGLVNFKVSNNGEPFDLLLYDLIGSKTTRMAAIDEENFTIDLSQLGSGMFFYKLTNSEGIIKSGKIILE